MNAQAPWLEIIMPVRNPGSKLQESIRSIIAQTERGFGVVISDNSSTSGLDEIETARCELDAHGIPCRVVKPPRDLGRVDHWNWAHYQSEAVWLKPLFVGDLLKPRFAAALRETAAAYPAQFARCNFEHIEQGVARPAAAPPTDEPFLPPADFLRYYPRLGNWIGAPVNLAYTRNAFVAQGGYDVHLPACADLNLYAAIALQYGIALMPETLAAFQLHTQRFSQGISKRKVNGSFELFITLLQLGRVAREAGLQWTTATTLSALWLQIRLDYLRPWKERLMARQ